MPTMQDVAKRAGVSQSTVSRVLNYENANVTLSQETIEKVLQAADELGYRIDTIARAMKGKSTSVIGIVVRRFDEFLPLLIHALADCFRQIGYMTINAETGNNPVETMHLHSLFESQFCDGLVLLGDPRGLDQTQIENLVKSKPLVTSAWGTPLHGIPMVNTDNRSGAKQVMEYLFELGHERIAFLDVGWSGDSSLRRQVYSEMMRARELSTKDYLITTNEGLEAGYDAGLHLLGLDTPPTAIFAAEDLLAFGVLRAANLYGINVPEQLSVVGFDNLPFADYWRPSLTTVHQPVHEIAEQVCTLLVELIKSDSKVQSMDKVILVEPRLIVRESTAPPGQ